MVCVLFWGGGGAPFIQDSLVLSNTAPLLVMRPSEKACVSSPRLYISRSEPSPSFHPSSARKLVIASGRYPSSRNSPTDVAPCLQTPHDST